MLYLTEYIQNTVKSNIVNVKRYQDLPDGPVADSTLPMQGATFNPWSGH